MRRNILFLWMLIASLGIAKANDVYVEVTSPEQLVVGAEYIIAAELSSEVYVATAYDDGSNKKCLKTTKTGFSTASNTITINTANPLVFELGGDETGYTLKYGSGSSYYYLGYSSDTHLSVISESSAITNKEKWIYTSNEKYATYFLENIQEGKVLLLHSSLFEFYVYGKDSEGSLNNNAPAHLYKKMTETIAFRSSNDEWGSVSIEGNTITATPADGYRVSKSNPYEVTEGKAEVIQDGNVFTVIPSQDCTIQINFEVIPVHIVKWSVNGVITTTEVLEDKTITFISPTNVPSGYVFKGWIDSEILTPQDKEPIYTTSATMGTTDITYYAAFAIATPDECTVTLTAEQVEIESIQERVFTDDKGNTWNAYCLGTTKDGMPIYMLNSQSYLASPEFPGMITGINILAYSTSNTADRTFYIKSTKDAEENIASILVSKDEKGTHELTFDISEAPAFNKFVMTSNNSVGFHYLKVTYASTAYSGYCTRVQSFETITLAEACTDGTNYYGTYSSGNAFVVPDDLTVSEIRLDDDKLVISNYEVGDIVPANTGVMVSSTTAGEHPVVLSDEKGTSILGDGNCLYPSGDNGISAEEMGEAHPDCVYYRLTMHNGEILGYYWGDEDGAAFRLAANKAYLALPKEKAARISGFDLADHEMTGIHTLTVMHVDGATYNLYGQRVGDSAKGIVIKNGKKQIKR